jgi:hypothetical protein
VTPRPAVALLLLLTPFLVAASDPSGDVGACRPGADGSTGATDGVDQAPDLVSATGTIVELGTSALWILRFADDLQVPDDRGTPFRVDLVLRDPSVPAVSFAYYRGLNRLVRYDAVADPTLTILLIPERGQNVFMPPTVDGDTMTIQVPGRILTADEDETGTSPGLEHMRWGVIVRDGRTCDLLGGGRPTERFEIGVASPPAQVRSPDTEVATSGVGGAARYVVVGVALAIGGALAYALLVRRRVSRSV